MGYNPQIWSNKTLQQMIRERLGNQKWLIDTIVDLTKRAQGNKVESINIPQLIPNSAQTKALKAEFDIPDDSGKSVSTLNLNLQIGYLFNVYDIDKAQSDIAETNEQGLNAKDAIRDESNLRIMNLLVNSVPVSAPVHLVPIADTTNKKLTEEDIQAAKVALDKQKAPQKDRFCIVSPEYANDLTSISNFSDVSKNPNAKGVIYDGYVGHAHGFDFIMQADCPLVDDDGTISETAENNTNKCAIFYQKLAACAAFQKKFSQKTQPSATKVNDIINVWSAWGELKLADKYIYVKYDSTDNDA